MNQPIRQAYGGPSGITDALIQAIDADGGLVDYNLLRNEYLNQHHLVKKGASLLVAGGAYKVGTVYGFNPQSAALIPFTFTRAGAGATRVNNQGLIENMAANVPRMDFDPVTKAFKGLLMERASTNLLAQSENYTTAWANANSNLAITAGIFNPVTGQNNFTRLRRTSTVTSAFISNSTTISFTAGTTYTLSLFAKFDSTDGRVGLRVQTTYPNRMDAVFNLSTGLFEYSAGSGSTPWTGVSTSAINMGNGVYRIAVTGTCNNTVSDGIVIGPAGGASPSGWEGSSTSLTDCLIWGVQLEQGTPTSYIPTAGTTVSRATETCVLTNMTGWYNQPEGSILVDWYKGNDNSGNQVMFELNDNTNTNRVAAFSDTAFGGNLTPRYITLGTTNPVTVSNNTLPLGSRQKYATGFKASDQGYYKNGLLVGSGTVVQVPSAALTLHLGNSNISTNLELNGQIRAFAYFPIRLFNNDLQAITT